MEAIWVSMFWLVCYIFFLFPLYLSLSPIFFVTRIMFCKHPFGSLTMSISFGLSVVEPRFWNPDRTVRSDRENFEPLIFAVLLTSRTVLWEKSRDRANRGQTSWFWPDRFSRFPTSLWIWTLKKKKKKNKSNEMDIIDRARVFSVRPGLFVWKYSLKTCWKFWIFHRREGHVVRWKPKVVDLVC